MNLRFYLDPETGQPHIYGHQVDEQEVEAVLMKPGRIVRDEKDRGSPLARHERDDTCGSFMFLILNRTASSSSQHTNCKASH